LDQRFRLLTGGDRTRPARQQTLHALIDWSYDLLSESERRLFARLSVFAGGWTLEAAERVCSGNGIEDWEVLDLLESLVDKSMVLVEVAEEAEEKAGVGSGSVRYRMLETIKQYATEKMAESEERDAVRTAHRDYFLALAEEAGPHLQGSEQIQWLDRLEAEHDNLRAALERCLAEAGLRLAGALWRFWIDRHHLREGRVLLAKALSAAGAEGGTALRAAALHGAGSLAQLQGDYEAARQWFQEEIDIRRTLGDSRGIADALRGLGHVASNQGDYELACTLHQQSLARWRELADDRQIAAQLTNVGNTASDPATRRAAFEESLAIFRRLEHQQGIAGVLADLGDFRFVAEADSAAARQLHEESLRVAQASGNPRAIARSLASLGSVAYWEADYAKARSCYQERLAIYSRLENRYGDLDSLEWLACVAARQGDAKRAAQLFAVIESQRNATGFGVSIHPISPAEHDRDVASVREALGEEKFAAAWAEGHALSLEDALAFALTGD
jgi:tetratricopeptide (TPR) repeat protein